MAVKWVLHWHPSAGATVNTQIMNEISQCIESLNGVKEGRWKSVLTFYKPITRGLLFWLDFEEQSMAAEFPRDFLGLSIPEQSNKYYFIIRAQQIVLEADLTIQTIMEKLQSYKSRVALNFEGIQYRVGDFQVRVGKVAPSYSETMRGIIMEVEYLPISSVLTAKQILEDFVDAWKDALSKKSLPGQFLHIEPNFGEYGLSDHYTSQHTAVQYATVMAQLIASVQAAQVRN